MGLLSSIRGVVDAIEPEPDRDERFVDAYWCDDCAVREPVRESEIEDERRCPECGETMRFERSPDSGHCAC